MKNYKLVYPRLGSKNGPVKAIIPVTSGGKRVAKVSTSVAPATMFQRMKGQTNPDVIKQVGEATTTKQNILNTYSLINLDKSFFEQTCIQNM